jgi:hypothetical protein
MAERLANNDFDSAVERWISDALARGASTFQELLRRLPGVYPSVVREELSRRPRGTLPVHFFNGTDGVGRVPGDMDAALRGWPLPHPLDYDWRFGSETATRLAEQCVALATPESFVTLLGGPSLVPALVRRGPENFLKIVDANPLMVDVLRRDFPALDAACLDVVTGPAIPIARSSVVIADPPWYPEHLRSFLWAARRSCRIGGHILLSLPPFGTRPGIENERLGLSKFADSLGLRLVRLSAAELEYRSPRFERNALKAAGISGVPGGWRHGDLAVYDCMGETTTPRPLSEGDPQVWDEVAVCAVRIKLRRREEKVFRDPLLQSIVPGDILPTVSRLDPRRRSVDVWTSGNRVYRTQGVWVVGEILRALAEMRNPVATVERSVGRQLSGHEAELVRRATDQFSNLIRLEQSDEETETPTYRELASTRA